MELTAQTIDVIWQAHGHEYAKSFEAITDKAVKFIDELMYRHGIENVEVIESEENS